MNIESRYIIKDHWLDHKSLNLLAATVNCNQKKNTKDTIKLIKITTHIKSKLPVDIIVYHIINETIIHNIIQNTNAIILLIKKCSPESVHIGLNTENI